MLKLFKLRREGNKGKAAGPGRISCILKDSLFFTRV